MNMNDTIDKIVLKSRLETVICELDSIYDPLDKIDRIADFIKEILNAYGTDEVVVASPLVSEAETIEEFEDCLKEYEEMSLEEAYEHLKSGEKIIWYEPYWSYKGITRDILFDNQSLWTETTIVRFGIINNKLMITLQQGKATGPEEAADPENIEFETDWIKPGNIYGVQYWIDLAKLLLNCDDIWKFNKLYPGIKKLNN